MMSADTALVIHMCTCIVATCISILLNVEYNGTTPAPSAVHGWLNIEYPASTFEFCHTQWYYVECIPLVV